MSEEKKCCGSCGNKNKELSNKELDKVNGGYRFYGVGDDSRFENGYWVCTSWKGKNGTCHEHTTINGVENVCTCTDRTNGVCCRVYGNNSICPNWEKDWDMCRYW